MKIATLAPGLILLLAAAAVAAPLDATTRDFDQLHLSLRVEPDLDAGTVRGEATLRFASLSDGLVHLRLHCEETRVLSVKEPKTERALPFVVEDGILTVDLPEPLAAGAEMEVAIDYESRPTLGFFFHGPTKRHPEVPRSFYTQGQGTWNRRWIPCYDLPDDRLTVEVRLVVPDELKTVGNGLKASEVYLPGPRREDRWVLDQRIPSYLITVAAGPYEIWFEERNGVLLEVNTFPGRLEEARLAFGRTGDMLDFFVDAIGVPYPYPRYAQTVVWDFVYGGMENASATTMNMRLLHTGAVRPNFDADGIVAHELAHQWFGDLLTNRTWEHIWLNEGFATYFADLFFEHADGTDEFRARRHRQNEGYLAGTPDPEKLGLVPSDRGDIPLELFGGKQYDRGAAILHMLRHEIGDGAFFDAIARYAREHADSPVVTEDFRRAAESESGRDLSWFFDQWVYGAGYPVLAVSYRHDANERELVVTVRQEQAAGGGQGLFRATLPIRIETEGEPVRANLPVQFREHEFRISCGRAPLHVRVDDGAWLLARIETEQSANAWIHQLTTDGDVVGRLVAIRALEKHGEEGAGAIAQALLSDDFHAIRRAAAEALGRLPGSDWAIDGLFNARHDEDARVREAVYAALGGRTRDEVEEPLVDAITEEKHPYVLAAAARSLGRIHAEGAFELLEGLLRMESHREIVRQGALEGLMALGDERAVGLAIRFLDYRYGRGAMSMMRKSALDLVLALAPDSRSTGSVVVRLLDDPYFRMRGWAADACGTYGIREAIPRLTEMAEKEAHGGARNAAKGALEKLTGAK